MLWGQTKAVRLIMTATKEGKTMSMMCSMQGCTQKQGMCGHEKMMLVMMAMLIVSGAAYWFLA